MRWPVAVVVVLSSVLFGYGLGQRPLLSGGPHTRVAALPNGAPPACDDTHVRAAVRAELQEFFARTKPTAAAASVATTTEPAAEQASANLAALQLLEQRVAQGTWRAADVERMRRLLDDVTDAQRAEITHQVILAINSGSIKPGAGVFRPF